MLPIYPITSVISICPVDKIYCCLCRYFLLNLIDSAIPKNNIVMTVIINEATNPFFVEKSSYLCSDLTLIA